MKRLNAPEIKIRFCGRISREFSCQPAGIALTILSPAPR
jgi:hypothetical protein